MSTQVAHSEAVGSVSGDERATVAAADLPPEVLRPLLEGARARGLADAFELIGIPAVLLDMGGAVLHVGAGAAARMGGSMAVASRHLVGTDSASNRALQDLVAMALAGKAETVKLEVAGTEGSLTVRSIPMPDGWDNPHQLLKAVIVFDDALKTVDVPSFGD